MYCWMCGLWSSTTSATCQVGGGWAGRLAGGGGCQTFDSAPASMPQHCATTALLATPVMGCSLPAGAVHAPYKHFDRHLDAIKQRLADAAMSPSSSKGTSNGTSSTAGEQQQQAQQPPPVYVVCRRGNDSQRAVAALRAAGVAVHAVDVVGGMEGWAAQVDPGFPTY